MSIQSLQYKLNNDKVYNLLATILPLYTLDEINKAIYNNDPINFIPTNENISKSIHIIVRIINKVLNKNYRYSNEEVRGVTNIKVYVLVYFSTTIVNVLHETYKELCND